MNHATAEKCRIRILVADDDPDIRETVTDILMLEGYSVAVYDPGAPRHETLEQEYDVVILDMVMPGTDGFGLRMQILKYSPAAQFIIITGHPDREMLDRAMDLGVFVFLPKPFTADHIRYGVMGALRVKALMRQNLARDLEPASGTAGLIGSSPSISEVKRRILQWAPLELPVLITGESGTGKEVVAHSIHRCSLRAEKRFTAINCAGLSPNLVESELFGHAQGAFTGATKTKHGFFEVTDGGTLFLDEIGDLPLELQSKLLRVLDRGEFTRVGETEPRQVNVRVISATNRDLEQMVAAGSFRADLYYRLKGTSIHLPALRERPGDIPALVRSFLGGDCAVAPEAMEALVGCEWQGNVRELRMIVESLKGISPSRIITADTVKKVVAPAGVRTQSGKTLGTYREFKERVIRLTERGYFEAIIGAAEGNIAQAARTAGMDRKNLYQKIKQLGIRQDTP